MRVILLQDVLHLGKAGEVRQVKDGYARNSLIPQRLVLPATTKNLKNLQQRLTEETRRRATEERRYRELAEKLATLPLRFPLTVSAKGRAFGSVTAQDIAAELATHGIAVEKHWIKLDQPIKTAGERTVTVLLPHQIEGAVKVMIEASAEESRK